MKNDDLPAPLVVVSVLSFSSSNFQWYTHNASYYSPLLHARLWKKLYHSIEKKIKLHVGSSMDEVNRGRDELTDMRGERGMRLSLVQGGRRKLK